jgi:hypothetical protein
MVAQAERSAMASFRLQRRTLMVPQVAERDRKRGKKRTFVPRASRLVVSVKEAAKVPSVLEAKAMPLSYRTMDNTSLVTLAHLSDHDAAREMLKRHIMDVDDCSYDEAEIKFKEIAKKNLEGAWLLGVPYRIGITAALVAGFGSIPMVFDLGTAQWFNEYFVTTDVPDPEDIETWLEVGSWTWNWMEPPLGQISFLLLCLQYSRAQMDNLGIKPYTTRIKRMRAKWLVKDFPQYDAGVLMLYSETSKMGQFD